jgi:hypothetical protein
MTPSHEELLRAAKAADPSNDQGVLGEAVALVMTEGWSLRQCSIVLGWANSEQLRWRLRDRSAVASVD